MRYIYITLFILTINNIFVLAKDITLDYNIKGMMCAMNCPDYIKEEAIKLDGVKKCNIDFNNASASITFDNEKIDEVKLIKMLMTNTDNIYDITIKNQKPSSSWWNWIFGK